MAEVSVLAAFSVVFVLQLAAAVFFHEPSSVELRPTKPLNHSDFGFSMAFQTALQNLVIGAPGVDNWGKVYTCELDSISYKKNIACDENPIDIATVTQLSGDIKPDQKFYTGSSVAASSNFIFTCAPLWTSKVGILYKEIQGTFGSCFVINETDTYNYRDNLDRFLNQLAGLSDDSTLVGGTGWSTLVDEENDLLLVVKTSLAGDFIYTPVSNPLNVSKSLMIDGKSKISKKFLKEHWNIGFGITAGKFFSNRTVYAFSMEMKNMRGAISFLQYSELELSLMLRSRMPLKIESKTINTMFGSTLGAADLNMDGKHELLVGAPAHSEEDCVECGALHIYLGGEMETIDKIKRLRTILGSTTYSRFGSAIATMDIDGDSIPELAISAPYEDEGLGAVYILSGYELYHNIVKGQTYKSIHLLDLKLKQRIQKVDFNTLGFSLQFVHDTDDNGCRELVVGSPSNGTALLLKCVQTINVTMSSELIGEKIVKEQDKNFTVKVCAHVDKYELPSSIIGHLSVTTSIIGEGTYIKDPNFVIDISCYECKLRKRVFCENVIVFLNDNEPGDYKFTSRAELLTDHILKSKNFNDSWVVASPHSRLVNNIEVHRHCGGDDCLPQLSMEVICPGKMDYVLGSSPNETVRIEVSNEGNASYEGCVRFRVSGAPLSRLNCSDENGGYKCYLRQPLKRNGEQSIYVVLDMTKPTNLNKGLLVEVELYEKCDERTVISNDSCQISYEFETNKIIVDGISHNRNVTDNQLLVSESIFDDQEYLITNNGTITWKNVFAIILMEKQKYNHSMEVTGIESANCKEDRSEEELLAFKCILDLMPNSSQKITVTNVLGKDMKDHLNEGMLHMTSHLQLYLIPTEEMLSANSTTVMYFQQELSLAQNKLLIAILAILLAIIILAIVIFVLYKYFFSNHSFACVLYKGFFRRKQKQRLQVLRDSIKRHNSRRITHTSEAKDGNAEGLQIDYDDDCPFDEIPNQVSSNDNAALVDDKAQVHC